VGPGAKAQEAMTQKLADRAKVAAAPAPVPETVAAEETLITGPTTAEAPSTVQDLATGFEEGTVTAEELILGAEKEVSTPRKTPAEVAAAKLEQKTRDVEAKGRIAALDKDIVDINKQIDALVVEREKRLGPGGVYKRKKR